MMHDGDGDDDGGGGGDGDDDDDDGHHHEPTRYIMPRKLCRTREKRPGASAACACTRARAI